MDSCIYSDVNNIEDGDSVCLIFHVVSSSSTRSRLWVHPDIHPVSLPLPKRPSEVEAIRKARAVNCMIPRKVSYTLGVRDPLSSPFGRQRQWIDGPLSEPPHPLHPAPPPVT
jgi:hypothetical protein